jgi:hypothetical protein
LPSFGSEQIWYAEKRKPFGDFTGKPLAEADGIVRGVRWTPPLKLPARAQATPGAEGGSDNTIGDQ